MGATICTPSTSMLFVVQLQSESISTMAAWNSSSRGALGIPSHASTRPSASKLRNAGRLAPYVAGESRTMRRDVASIWWTRSSSSTPSPSVSAISVATRAIPWLSCRSSPAYMSSSSVVSKMWMS